MLDLIGIKRFQKDGKHPSRMDFRLQIRRRVGCDENSRRSVSQRQDVVMHLYTGHAWHAYVGNQKRGLANLTRTKKFLPRPKYTRVPPQGTNQMRYGETNIFIIIDDRDKTLCIQVTYLNSRRRRTTRCFNRARVPPAVRTQKAPKSAETEGHVRQTTRRLNSANPLRSKLSRYVVTT